ncbi:MAG: phosphatidate cytidylyltransferase [Phycisphaeraceae bacterium]|nr:phosphatidate cytidylyltransferase [Phycisphaeraceae bacterium]
MNLQIGMSGAAAAGTGRFAGLGEHLFSMRGALDHPVTVLVVAIVAGALVLTPVSALVLRRMGRLPEHVGRDVRTRYLTWLVLAPAMLAPILLFPLAAMLAVCAASLVCYREYARATGLFRHRALSAIVVLGIVGVTVASVLHWYELFTAMTPLTVVALAASAIVSDAPKGYIQRVSLAVVGFLLFGAGLGHLAYMANDANYRPLLCMLLLCTQASDIAAYCFGKAFGRRRLFPNTSPNKTLAGHAGALAVVVPLCAGLAHLVMEGTAFDRPHRLLLLGLMVGVGAQMGDLMLGSIKRDIGIKDMGATLPGHGGFLDRFNSVLLVAPAAFHYIGLFTGFGLSRHGGGGVVP